MKNIWSDIKWLFNYISSILMYGIIFIFILVGCVLAIYFVDFKIKSSRIEAPLYSAYVIVSGSMEPIIKIKDAVLIKRVDPDKIKKGDVVTYRSMDEMYYGILITHRVIDIKEENGKKVFITKGDHNETPDRSSVDGGQIYGKVVMRIPKIGYLKYFLTSSYGWILAVVIPSVGIILYDIMKIVRNLRKKDDKKDIYESLNIGKKVVKYEE